MKPISKTIKLLITKPFAFIYVLTLTTLVFLFDRYNPLAEMLSGLIKITGADYIELLVSATQYLVDKSVILPMLAVMTVLAVLLALVCAILFAGFLGSLARGTRICASFPAPENMGFWEGYKKRFLSLILLFAVSILSFELLLLVWVISAVPLAVVSRAVEIGVLSDTAMISTAAITLLVVYLGSVLLRVHSLACITTLYSQSKKPIRAGVRYANEKFWVFLRYFFLVDVALIFLLLLDNATQKSVVVLAVRCIVSSIMIFFILIAFFCRFSIRSDDDRNRKDGGQSDEEDYDGYNANGDYRFVKRDRGGDKREVYGNHVDYGDNDYDDYDYDDDYYDDYDDYDYDDYDDVDGYDDYDDYNH